MSKEPLKAVKIPRPWKVTIKATVTKTLEIEKTPAHAETMGDAVSLALDEFRAENNWEGVKILEASVTKNE